jgi:hypothetical protein
MRACRTMARVDAPAKRYHHGDLTAALTDAAAARVLIAGRRSLT